ncbi:hypothetical protein BLAT2472_60007 [Burkholderia latens]
MSISCASSHAARSVPANALACAFTIRCAWGLPATTGCNATPSVPGAKIGAPAGATCCTTITGTPAACAASIARPMFASDASTGGYSTGRPPVTYSFCTSMTISARREAETAEDDDTAFDMAGLPVGLRRAAPERNGQRRDAMHCRIAPRMRTVAR